MTEPLPLTVRRVVAAPPTKLFEAWTTPALLRSWWGPKPKDVCCIKADVDHRIGGAYRDQGDAP